MALIQYDISDLPMNLRQSIRTNAIREEQVQFELAKVRQAKIAKFYRNHPPRSLDGMGGQELAIDPFFVRYLAMQGIDFYGDPEVGKWLQKRHEEFRVKSGGTRLQVGYTGVSGAATRKRSSKTFPAAAPAAGESKRSEQRNKQT